ncbi:hypothetical protein J6590_074077, partial [Homalodisca vitripennis]
FRDNRILQIDKVKAPPPVRIDDEGFCPLIGSTGRYARYKPYWRTSDLCNMAN